MDRPLALVVKSSSATGRGWDWHLARCEQIKFGAIQPSNARLGLDCNRSVVTWSNHFSPAHRATKTPGRCIDALQCSIICVPRFRPISVTFINRLCGSAQLLAAGTTWNTVTPLPCCFSFDRSLLPATAAPIAAPFNPNPANETGRPLARRLTRAFSGLPQTRR